MCAFLLSGDLVVDITGCVFFGGVLDRVIL